MLVDYRCPVCNQPVQGKEDVAIRKTEPAEKLTCQNCKTECGRVLDDEPAVHVGHPPVKSYYYDDEVKV